MFEILNVYKDFKKEITDGAIKLYNLFPDEVKILIETGTEATKDTSQIIKLIKLYNSFKERFLIKKIERFLENVGGLSLDEINNLIEKCQETKEKFTNQLIVTIDRLESEEKIDYLAELFIMFAKNKLDKRLYFRCCKVLDNYSYLDLKNFQRKNKYYMTENEDAIALLMGLLKNLPPVKEEPINAIKMSELILTEAGEVFLKLNKQ